MQPSYASHPDRARLALLVTALLLAAACSAPGEPATEPTGQRSDPASTPAAVDVAGTVAMPDGVERTFRLHVPPGLDLDVAAPLLVALHGGTGSGAQFQATSGFDALADANGFLVVYPDGTRIGGSGPLSDGRAWNGGRCCGPAASDGVDDVAFIATLLDQLTMSYAVDPARVFAAGHSNGAIMSYRLACELADRIVAIGVQAGSLEIDECRPSRPVSALHVHGTADTNLPLEGGRGSSLARTEFSRPRDAVLTLAAADSCPAPVRSVDPDNADVMTETWSPCDQGTGVEFVTVEGASHAWMGRPVTPRVQALVGEPYLELDVASVIWAFLSQHPRELVAPTA